MYKFIWGSKWINIGRSQLCCDVKEGGGKMININQYVLSLRFNLIFKLYDNIRLERKSYPIENNIYLTNKNNICIEK